MRPTEILVKEHDAVKVLLEVLDVICGKLDSKERVEPDHIQDIVHFIRKFADKAHHMKEEDVLFPVMEEAGIPKEEMLLEAIITEHDLGRGYVRGISDALLFYSIGDNSAGLVISENAKKYVRLMTDHIGKEERVVFPLAEARLSETAQRELAQEFQRIDKEVIGEERREEFMSILHSLRGEYLSVS